MKVEIEIMRTRTVTIDEHCVVELDVPKSVLREYEDGDSSALIEWLESKASAETHLLINREMEMSDEDEVIEYDSAELIEG